MARRMLHLPMMVLAAVLACVAAVATLLAVSKEAQSTFPGKNGRIAFVSTRDSKTESGDIYTMNPNGTAVHRLTNFSGYDFEPAWSPGGSKIAFQSNRAGKDDIYTMTPNGTRVERSPTIQSPTFSLTGLRMGARWPSRAPATTSRARSTP